MLSYAIVMWEIASRQRPYESEEYGPGGRILRQRILDGLRPSLDAIRSELRSTLYIALMQEAWVAEPTARPTFESVSTSLQRLPRHLTLPLAMDEVGLYPGMTHGTVEVLELSPSTV
jgi:hypothetical protein